MNYFIVRVNTPNHTTRELAMADMGEIIRRGGYWKMSQPVFNMQPGDAVIAVGGHGGRGLFLHGIVRGKKWKKVKGGGEYQWMIRVTWDSTVYMHFASTVNEVLSAAGIQGIPPNLRKHSQINKRLYRDALHIVLSGAAVNPWEYVEQEAA